MAPHRWTLGTTRPLTSDEATVFSDSNGKAVQPSDNDVGLGAHHGEISPVRCGWTEAAEAVGSARYMVSSDATTSRSVPDLSVLAWDSGAAFSPVRRPSRRRARQPYRTRPTEDRAN